MSVMKKGLIHSFQSMGTLDGPGVRFVVFVQGCNRRCACCHNPDTWSFTEGKEYTAKEIVDRVVRYKEYFKDEGGITVSGGEPLLQADFVYDVFRLCHEKGINTCLDTSGGIVDEGVKKLLTVTDRILLDIKYTSEDMYNKYVGCRMSDAVDFLCYANVMNIPVTLRQVIIPSLNDTEDNIVKLKQIKDGYTCVDKVELLPFRKICQVKYDKMGIKFPLSDTPEPDKEKMSQLESLLLN